MNPYPTIDPRLFCDSIFFFVVHPALAHQFLRCVTQSKIKSNSFIKQEAVKFTSGGGAAAVVLYVHLDLYTITCAPCLHLFLGLCSYSTPPTTMHWNEITTSLHHFMMFTSPPTVMFSRQGVFTQEHGCSQPAENLIIPHLHHFPFLCLDVGTFLPAVLAFTPLPSTELPT